jgi:hypothetical protein
MEKDYLFLAIRSLKPTSEFTFSANDYSTIQWDVLEGNAPTKSQIDAEIVKIKAAEATETEIKSAAKAALLERLGITAEEATLLLG